MRHRRATIESDDNENDAQGPTLRMKDRLIRRVMPSMPVMARWPVVPRLLDTADWFLRRQSPEYARLPPASLRMRIGVGNRLLRNAAVFDQAQSIVRRCVESGLVGDGARVLDLGSGIGRNAVALRDQVRLDSYDGIDVDAETYERLAAASVAERRPIPWQAEVILKRALAIPAERALAANGQPDDCADIADKKRADDSR